MPGRNIVKQYGAGEFYHVYSRGVAKQLIFLDDDDYVFFLSLLKRYLSAQAAKSPRHGVYPHYGTRLELLTYCLMPNHIHLLVYQHDETAMQECMKSLMASYGMYFNRKYKRVGPVFQSRYKASRITTPTYLEHISRYIHLNPKDWQHYPYSSYKYFLNNSPDWLHTNPIMAIFNNSLHDYTAFLHDYEDQKQMLDEIKWELANR